ncbi:MAG TPA: glycosyltransferase [Ktedonobacterales bacterium]
MLWAILGALILLANLVPVLDLARHFRDVPLLSRLTRTNAGEDERLPRLSVIVPARNEEHGVRAAVQSMLRADYPNLEVIAVDDRSIDRTGEILAALEREHTSEHPGRLRVMTIHELPNGWLGKNHALWVGARSATGDWLLFTDADVVFEATCFRRAVAYSERERLDHLTLSPRLLARGYWLNAFIDFFNYAFTVFQRPDLANNPKSNVAIGVGAFNLIRRVAYEAIGTHAAISLRPDDDMRLAKRVKRRGLRQRVLNGADLLSVDWYPSLGAAIRGLEKNAFAGGANYSVAGTLASIIAVIATLVLPYGAVLVTRPPARWLFAGTIGIQATSFIYTNSLLRRPATRYFPVFPLAALLFCFAVLRSMWLTLRHGGIRWRETFYPLAELRRQTGLE